MSEAPGNTHAMPTIAMSDGRLPAGFCGAATSTDSSHAVAPSLTSRWRSSIEHGSSRSAATCPIMYMPSDFCSSSPNATSSSPTRLRPLDAIRRRPRFMCSRRAQISLASAPDFSSRSRSARNPRVYADSAQRVAWPGAVSSRIVPAQSIAACWYAGTIAPVVTASRVNRYAVPMSMPMRAPRAASGAAIAATIAADRASWIPPAKTTETSASRSKASSRSIWLCHRTKLESGPTWPPHSRPSNTNRRAPSLRNKSRSPREGTCR